MKMENWGRKMKYKLQLLIQPNTSPFSIIVDSDSFEHSGNLLFFYKNGEVALIINANMLIATLPEQ
jgi:hypothetical protein